MRYLATCRRLANTSCLLFHCNGQSRCFATQHYVEGLGWPMPLCCFNNQVRPDTNDHCDALLLGPEGAGKTLLTRRLQGLHDKAKSANFHASTFPTTGVELTHVKCASKDVPFKRVQLRELGGCMGPIWPSYYEDCQSLVYVVDGSEPSSWQAAGQQLQDILNHPSMQVKPCLVLLNKSDLASDKNASAQECQAPILVQAEESLSWKQHMEKVAKGMLTMQLVSALEGEGIQSVLAWMVAKKAARLLTPA